MSVLSFMPKWLRCSGRRKGTTTRKPIRSRLALEALEERSLMSANVLQTNLVSDLPGVAQVQDPNLVNPWGISQGPGPLWISDNNAGVSTVYTGQGQPTNPLDSTLPPLVVNIPTPGDPTGHSGTPDGTVFNPTFLAQNPGFVISDGMHSAPAIFLFATEDGTIVGWHPGVNPAGSDPTQAGTFGTIAVDNSGTGAVYKGLTLATDATGQTLLYAANFRSGQIDVFDTNFNPVTTLPAGAFTDPNLPTGYAPFNVEQLGGKIYVTYALQDAAMHDPVSGAHHGFVDVFNLDGSPGLSDGTARLVSSGKLDSPWGLALAPKSYGKLAGDLLVGNFGNGKINVYNPVSGSFLNTLQDPDGEAIQIDGLWALKVGNGFGGTDTSTVYFTAGLDHEQHGLFGSLTSVAPGTPEGPAEAQAVVAALDVLQIDFATLTNDINNGASGSTIAQDMQTLNTDFAALKRAEQRFANDGDHHGMAPSVAMPGSAVGHTANAQDVIFADLDGHIWDRV
jgi:uncharacterized protein (TIGR03118 family)